MQVETPSFYQGSQLENERERTSRGRHLVFH